MRSPCATTARGPGSTGADCLLGGSIGILLHPIPERHYFAACRIAGCRGFGLVTLLAGDTGHDFRPSACCADPLRCGDKVAHPPEFGGDWGCAR